MKITKKKNIYLEQNELFLYNSFKSRAFSRLITKIELFNNLQKLYFDRCMIKDKGAIFIGNYLVNNICLKELTLINDFISTIGLEAIGYGLRNNTTLEYLNLKNSTLEKIDPIIINLKTNNSLSTLNISSIFIYNYTFLLLNDLFKINQSIINLDISNITYPEFLFYGRILFIQDALKINTTLENLNFSENFIDDEFALSLSETLLINKTLTKLNLSNNLINDRGYNAIINNLKYNKNILEINLKSNLITISLTELDILLKNNFNKNKFWKYPKNLAKFNKQFFSNIICAILCCQYNMIYIPSEIWMYICEFNYL
jgi:hypothetical protein